MSIILNNHHKSILLIVAILGGYLGYSTFILEGSQPYYRDYDPEMAYFMNSLSPFKGKPYYYTDHPGTPIEMIGTAMLSVTSLFFRNRDEFIQYHIREPQLFLNLAHIIVTLLSILCAAYFYRTATQTIRGTNIPLAISLALVFFGLHSYSLTTLTVWSHTAFNFPLGTLYLIFLYRIAHDNAGFISNKAAVGLGSMLGLMIAVMVNFLPWLVTTFIFILLYYRLQKTTWNKILATSGIVACSTLAGFALAVLPASHRLPYFFGFIQDLINHQMPYGNGPQGVTTLPLLWKNLQDMFIAAPVIFLSVFVSLIISAVIFLQCPKCKYQTPGLWTLNIALISQCLLIMLIVLKHPGERFLLPLAATIPVLFLAISNLSEYNPSFSRILNASIITFSIIGIGWFTVISLQQKQMELLQTRLFEAQVDLAISEQTRLANKNPGDLLILWSNLTYSACSARLYGNYYTAGAFSQEVNELCPSQAYFFFRENWVLYHGNRIAINDLNWDILITNNKLFANNPGWSKAGEVWEYPGNVVLVKNKR